MLASIKWNTPWVLKEKRITRLESAINLLAFSWFVFAYEKKNNYTMIIDNW